MLRSFWGIGHFANCPVILENDQNICQYAKCPNNCGHFEKWPEVWSFCKITISIVGHFVKLRQQLLVNMQKLKSISAFTSGVAQYFVFEAFAASVPTWLGAATLTDPLAMSHRVCNSYLSQTDFAILYYLFEWHKFFST